MLVQRDTTRFFVIVHTRIEYRKTPTRTAKVIIKTACVQRVNGKYSPQEKAEIGGYVINHGVMRAVRHSSRKHEGSNESTVHSFRTLYREVMLKKRQAGESLVVRELPSKQRGRPVLIGKKLDDMVQDYILSVRVGGGMINTPIVIAGSQGIVKTIDRSMLVEYGGSATFTKGWAKSLLRRMKFSRRMSTTQLKIAPDQLQEQQV